MKEIRLQNSKRKKITTTTIVSLLAATILTISTSSIAQNLPVNTKNESIIDYQGTTLDKIRQSGKIVLGHRLDLIPLSYQINNQPMGYAIDTCLLVIEKIKEETGLSNLKTEYLSFTNDGLSLLRSGKIDLECGATPNNPATRKDVYFSIPYYISSIKVLTNDNNIHSLSDLQNKRISVEKSSNAFHLINKANVIRGMNLQINQEGSYISSFKSVAEGKFDGMVAEDFLLLSIRSFATNPNKYPILEDMLSVEPIGIGIRKNDPLFRNIVDKSMVSVITSGQLKGLYSKWFEKPIPPRNQNLNAPASPLLKDIFRMPTFIVGNN